MTFSDSSCNSPPSLEALRILLVGLNVSPEPTSIGKYSGEMAECLAGCGHSVTVVSTAHRASFGASALPASIIAAMKEKPHIVGAIVPTLAAAAAALLAARIAGAESWIHVQDLEGDAAFEHGILGQAGLGQGGATRRAALAAERALINRFDLVTTKSEAMRERLSRKGVERVALFFN